jgi:hypothetical protein
MNTTTRHNINLPGRALIALGAATWLTLAPAAASAEERIAFKLDPRITSGRYMGEHWATPATFVQVQGSGPLTVAAKTAQPVSWRPTDSSIVTVAPAGANQVNLIIHRAGQTTVAAGGKTLAIKAEPVIEGVLKVEITQ